MNSRSDIADQSLIAVSSAGSLIEDETVKETGMVGVVIPVVAEELHVDTRIVTTGSVQIHKSVQQRQEIVDPPLMRETVTVETVEVNRIIEGPPPTDRQEGDTLIVPVVEEVLVVEKRLLLKSEIHIRRVQETFHAPQSVTLNKEQVIVERHSVATDLDSAEFNA